VSIIIDSSIWISWLRSRTDPRPLIRPWLLRDKCYTCGIIKIEVLRGIIDKKQKNKLSELLSTMRSIELDNELLTRAADLAWSLDRKGKPLPLTDLVIAECARASNSSIVTIDKHFKQIPGLKIRSSLPKSEI